MRTTKYTTCLTGIALFFATSAFAETIWSFDSTTPENNTKTGAWTINDADTTVDVSNGILTVTGQFDNRGSSTLLIGSNTSSAYSDYYFDVGSAGYARNLSSITLKNINLYSQLFISEGAGVVTTIDGYVCIGKGGTSGSTTGAFNVKNGAKAIVLADSFLRAQTAEIGANGRLEIKNGQINSVVANWEFKTGADSRISIGLSNDSLTATGNNAIMKMTFGKTLNGIIELDLSNFALGSDFVLGTEYTISLVYNTSNQTGSSQFDDTWMVYEANVTNGQYAEFVSAEKNGQNLFVTIVAVPEPATYAAVFGALALAFAAYRRRK